MKLMFVILVGFLASLASGGLGYYFGAKHESTQVEIERHLAGAMAEENLEEGNLKEATRYAHFAKAFEKHNYASDKLLGEVYLKKEEPCLAKYFLMSSLQEIDKHALWELSFTEKIEKLYKESAEKCDCLLEAPSRKKPVQPISFPAISDGTMTKPN